MGKVNPNSYYHADALLNKKDLDGLTPEIFCVCGNRSGGKTTDISKKLVDGWMYKKYREVMILKRWANETKGSGINFFNKEFLNRFFPGIEVEIHERKVADAFYQIYVDDDIFGWVVPINLADKVKKYSNLFNNVDIMFFDEFMPETGAYCPNEVDKLKSIHVSVARAYGEQSRYVPLIMASNLVTLLNPYFSAWGMASRITNETRFLRGHGVVLEQNFNKSAAEAQKKSRFLAAFGEDDYYTTQGVYLQDSLNLVGKYKGRTEYFCTFKVFGNLYAIKLTEDETIYADKKIDNQFPRKIAATVRDVDADFMNKARYPQTISFLTAGFNSGLFRFENQEVKDAVFKLLQIS